MGGLGLGTSQGTGLSPGQETEGGTPAPFGLDSQQASLDLSFLVCDLWTVMSSEDQGDL